MPDNDRNSHVSEPSALSDKAAPPWWVDLDEVFVLEFVASSSCEPVGLYANRAEVHGAWRDIILGWEGKVPHVLLASFVWAVQGVLLCCVLSEASLSVRQC